jgi:hypothetical protein
MQLSRWRRMSRQQMDDRTFRNAGRRNSPRRLAALGARPWSAGVANCIRPLLHRIAALIFNNANAAWTSTHPILMAAPTSQQQLMPGDRLRAGAPG